MNVRSEETADHEAIQAVLAASFPTRDEARLVEALRSAGRLSVSLVAEDQGKVVGYVAFSPVSVPGSTDGLGLAPIAVVPAFQRRGIGAQLVVKGLEVCKELNRGFVVVLGDPGYYRRFGFMPASGWGLRDEYGGKDAFQAMELRPGAIPAGGGVVRYAPEFSAFGDEGSD